MKDTSPKYHVYLRQQDFGARKKDVFEALRQSVPKLNLNYQNFGTNLRGSDCIHSWAYVTDTQLKILEKRFSELEIKLDVKTVEATFLFPSDTVTGNFNQVYSTALLNLGEDALDDYANLIGIKDIYRFTLFPTFTPAITVRVSEHEIVKKEAATREVASSVNNWNPSEKQWSSILREINKYQFWTSTSWNTLPDDLIYRDGEILIFEGYRDGLFKFLYDENPDSGSAYELHYFFLSLKPDSE